MEAGRSFSHILLIFFAASLLFPATFAVKVNYCDRRHNYPVKVDGVNISPDPVESGEPATFTISASTDKVLTGGKFVVEVALLGIRIHSETHNLCEETTCPVKAGKFDVSHSQNLPLFTPPGVYNVKIIMKDTDDKQLTCISFKLRIVFFDSNVPSDGLAISEVSSASEESAVSDS